MKKSLAIALILLTTLSACGIQKSTESTVQPKPEKSVSPSTSPTLPSFLSE